MKKLAVLSLLLMLVLALVACGQDATPTTDSDTGEVLSGTINIAGSTSVQPYSDLLKEAFEAKYPDVTVNVQGGGSSAGVTAAISGAADIGAASRELKDSELAEGVWHITIAKDGIAVVVHPTNSVENLTIEQIRAIYMGQIKNWSEVGGTNTPVNVITREEGSGTRGAFEDIVIGKGNEIDGSLITQGSTGAVSAAVANDPNGIGYISLASLDSTVKAVKVNGADATIANIASGTYEVARPFNYVTKEEPSGLVKEFIDFAMADEGQFVGESLGLIAINSPSGTVNIAGSTSVQPFSDNLKEAFEKIHPNITVNVQGGGSSAGFTSVGTGAADIGALSRELKKAEKASGYPEYVIAKDGIALVVHKDNPVDSLTIEQVRNMYLGEITNWNQVGGADKPVNAITREEGSGTRGAFEDIVMGKGNEIVGRLITQGSTGAVMASVATDANGIGYVSLASVDDSVNVIRVDGVEATVENIQDGTYAVARPFNYITQNETDFIVKGLINFTLGKKGQKIAGNMGLISIR